jgi:hypothetical protein
MTATTNTNKYSGSTTTTPSLTIFSVQQSDVGTYTCYGSNSVGTVFVGIGGGDGCTGATNISLPIYVSYW